MEPFHATSFAIGLLVGIVIAAIFLRRRATPDAANVRLDALLSSLDNRMEAQTNSLLTSMGELREGNATTIGETFRKTQASLSETLNRSQKNIEEKLQGVLRETGEIKGAAELMLQVGKDVDRLSKVLDSSGKRGAFGEMQLELLLSDIIPKEKMQLQYRLASGAVVDAAVFMRDGLTLCIDSKFPLPNLLASYAAEGDEAKRLKKTFYSDVRKRAKEIADKYIVPQKTLDFAIMFIPSESVFLEIISNRQEHEKLLEMNIVPASPNFLYVYLQALSIGFRGMAIEEKTKQIMGAVDRLKREHENFGEKFALLGKHLDNAKNVYSAAGQEATKLGNSLEDLEKIDGEKN